jgi:hypothetical protein
MRAVNTAIILVFAFTIPCHAQGDKAKPNTLTPKEIADGWLLLFDGETTFGWQDYIGKTTKKFEVKDGMLSITGGSVKHKVPFGDYELSFEYRANDEGAIFSWFDKGLNQFSKLSASPKSWKTYSFTMSKGPDWKDEPDETAWGVSKTAPGTTLSLRNVRFRPLNTKSIFNAKDLEGWRVFPGDKYKSRFTVKDGAINVKDGPGDLQTVGKYKDFILQFDCISNGKHLNSGVFFRCRDNEYQNGYEAQIRNQFTKEATQKYLIEEYDPMTNKLAGKKEIMSTAFDFGTGAIYRRVPARKEMSKDNEWFGMTIVAHGNHLATWVNGVQMTDWFDHRPKSENARTGCKLDAGHISIQGHDPTTDLSFKNFRIAEFK